MRSEWTGLCHRVLETAGARGGHGGTVAGSCGEKDLGYRLSQTQVQIPTSPQLALWSSRSDPQFGLISSVNGVSMAALGPRISQGPTRKRNPLRNAKQCILN